LMCKSKFDNLGILAVILGNQNIVQAGL